MPAPAYPCLAAAHAAACCCRVGLSQSPALRTIALHVLLLPLIVPGTTWAVPAQQTIAVHVLMLALAHAG